MKWITTNIRFPEDMYMELKMQAALNRTSVAEIVRNRVKARSKAKTKKSTAQIIKELEKLAQENSKYVPKDKNFSDLLIEMRYEQ